MSSPGVDLTRVLSVGIVVSWMFVAKSFCEDARWPQFRGPQSQGIAGPVDVPDEFGLEKNLIWKTKVPLGVSSPCIWGDRVFLTGHDRDRDALETLCVDRLTGDVLWRHDAPVEKFEWVHRASSPASATPVTDGKCVFVYFGSYGLICYDNSGHVVWSRPLDAVENRWGMGTSPILAEGRLILVCDQGGMARNGGHSNAISYVLALDPANGEQMWKINRPEVPSGWSTPIIYRRSEAATPLLVTYSADRLSAYRIDDGDQIWSVGQMPHDAVATPVVGNGLIFVTGTVFAGDVDNPFRFPSYGEMIKRYDTNKDKRLARDEVPAVPIDPRGRAGQVLTLRSVFNRVDRDKNGVATFFEWTAASVFVTVSTGLGGGGGKDGLVAIRPSDEGDGTKMDLAWTVNKSIPDNPSPLYYNQRIYLAKSGGILSCIEAETGRIVKRKRISANGKISSSPIVGNDRLYVCTERGDIVVLDADDQMNQRAHNKLGERIMATPALVANRLYVRTDDHLFAFGSSNP